jgi:hypothetical protein
VMRRFKVCPILGFIVAPWKLEPVIVSWPR